MSEWQVLAAILASWVLGAPILWRLIHNAAVDRSAMRLRINHDRDRLSELHDLTAHDRGRLEVLVARVRRLEEQQSEKGGENAD